ncbi:TPA: hypothetical protein ACPPG8_000273 [Haemophilus influenzae]|uniref:hypothetical protein n=1 Tax=Haemophilus influenzae TaxID=727 RepID=UPI00223FA387|nr:hypothetical protein [Haemophilus influenzae]
MTFIYIHGCESAAAFKDLCLIDKDLCLIDKDLCLIDKDLCLIDKDLGDLATAT